MSAGPPQPWLEDRPGYEFDGAFPIARRPRPGQPGFIQPELTQPEFTQPGLMQPRPAAPPPRRPRRDPPPADPASTEWGRLLRSLLPQPEKHSLVRQFRANLHFRGWGMRVAIPILTMIAVGVAVVVVVGANSGNAGPAPSAATLGFPPATLAGQDFTAAGTTRGIDQSLGRVASAGDVTVAVGSETGAVIPRAQFFYSLNGGGSWSLGTESAAAGGTPQPGHGAELVAGGQGEWVAIGPDAIWTSGNGEAWTLVSTTGLPDQVTVLRRTGSGFIAAGSDALFLSANGTSWERFAAPGGALDVKYVAVNGNTVLIAGDVSGGFSGAWISDDGGRDWTPIPIPRGHGAQDQIAGLAPAGTGFVVARPAVVRGAPAADIYRSSDGSTWTLTATLTDFTVGLMNGGPGGAVLAGQAAGTQDAGALTAFVSPDGARWSRIRISDRPQAVSGVAVTGAGAIVATDSAGDPQITTIASGGVARQLSLTAIPGAVDPQLAVNAVAAQGNSQVAVGGANGYPAVWMSTDGGSDWDRAAGQTPSVLSRPGDQQLTSVTYGSAGWLAVGGVTGGAPQHPVVIVAADGTTWTAADKEQAFSGSGLFTEQAAAGPQGYVIVGYQQTAGGSTVAAVWWSAGLTGWQRVTSGSMQVLDGASGNRQMLAVTATTAGFVAVGLQGNSPAAWTSSGGGRAWSVVDLPLPAGATRSVLLHVAAVGSTVVAVGMSQTPSGALQPFAARSVDGGTMWTETALPVPSGTAAVTALAAAGGTFTATGTFGTTAGHQDVVVWTSPNGLTWTAATPAGQGLAGPGIQAITGLTVSGSTLTGVGFTASPASEEPVFWQSPIR